MKGLLMVLLLIGGLSTSIAFAADPVDKYSNLTCEQIERGYYFNIDALKALLEQYEYCVQYTTTNPDKEIQKRVYLCEFLYDHADHVTGVINRMATLFKEKECLGASF